MIRATGNPEKQGSVSEYKIFRGELSKVLVGLTKDDLNVKYIFDEQVASMQHQESEGIVEFANGTSTATYDLIVACDSATSRPRAIAFNCGLRDHIHPVNTWAAYFSLSQDLLEGSNIGHGFSAPGGRFISISRDPTGGNRVMLMCVNQPISSIEEFQKAASAGDEAWKTFVSRQYADMGWRTPHVLQEMADSNDFYASEIVQVKHPSLRKNRVVLVGDAGYAAGPTGGGTSLALAGGYMLAGSLLQHPGAIEAALNQYESHMNPLIREMRMIPPFVGTIMAPQTRWGSRRGIISSHLWRGRVSRSLRRIILVRRLRTVRSLLCRSLSGRGEARKAIHFQPDIMRSEGY